MATTARRIAGTLGCGGPSWILFFPVRFGEATALQIGVGDHCHQRVTMQAMPGSALEVIETQFVLELLMRLLANPTRLDCGGELVEIDRVRQVGQMIFSFARPAPFAHEPRFLAGICCWPLSPMRCGEPSAMRTRTAAKAAHNRPFVPFRQLRRRHFACSSIYLAGTES